MTKRLLCTLNDPFPLLTIDSFNEIMLLLTNGHEYSKVAEVLRLINRLFYQRVVALISKCDWHHGMNNCHIISWPYLKRLTVYSDESLSGDILEKLKSLVSLKIYASENGYMKNNSVFNGPLFSLKTLEIYSGSIRNEDFVYLTSLESLLLQGTQGECKPMGNIGLLTNLTTLGIYRSQIIGDEDLMLLTNLTRLDLVLDDRITNRSVSMLTNLVHISLEETENITFDALKNFKSLTSLSLEYNWQISSVELGQMTHLQRLNLGGNDIIESKDLVKLHQLTALDVSYNEIITAEAVGSLKNLVELNISRNRNIREETLLSLPLLKKLYVNDIFQIAALGFATKTKFDIYLG